MIGDDKVFDENLRNDRVWIKKIRKGYRKKWCRENQHKNYNNKDYEK